MTTNNSANLINVASGSQIGSIKVVTLTASTSANLELTGLSALYSKYEFVYDGLIPDTDNVSFEALIGSVANGYINVNYGLQSIDHTGTQAHSAAGNTGAIILAQTVTNGGAFAAVVGTGTLVAQHEPNISATLISNVQSANSVIVWSASSGSNYDNTDDITKIKFQFSTGNILSGRIFVYAYPI